MPNVRPERQLQQNVSSISATDNTDDAFDDFSLGDGLTAASSAQACPARAPPELTVSSAGDWSIALAREAELANQGSASSPMKNVHVARPAVVQGVQRIANATRLGQAKLSGRPARYAKLDEEDSLSSRRRYAASLVTAISTAVKPLSRWVQPGESTSMDAAPRQSRCREAPRWEEDRAPAVWLDDARVDENGPLPMAAASESEPLDCESPNSEVGIHHREQGHAERSAAATATAAAAATATAAAAVTAAVSGAAATAASAAAELGVRLDSIKVRCAANGREEPLQPGEPQAPQQSLHGRNGHPCQPSGHANAKAADEINHRLFIKLVTILGCALGLPLLIIIVFSIGTGGSRTKPGTSELSAQELSSSRSPSQRPSSLLSQTSSPPLPTRSPLPQPPSPTPPPHPPRPPLPSGPPAPNAPPPAVPSPRPSNPPLPTPDQAALDSRYLNQAKCSALFADPGSRLHQLWSTEGWLVRRGGTQGCWGDDPDTFFTNAERGTTCGRNWYEGNKGKLGWEDGGPTKDWVWPHFTDAAPALLGFDEDINVMCHSRQGDQHAHGCVRTNFNILSLFRPAQYNSCRNFEWQICAALGTLPGQRSSIIRFARAPGELELEAGPHPLGACNSYHPAGCANNGYASSDIFYLEVCIFSTICSNGAELFSVDEGQDWTCQLNHTGLSQLKSWLLP